MGTQQRSTHLSEVGFEPTPSIEDQKSHNTPYLRARVYP